MNPSMQSDDARFLELLERWLSGDYTRKDERDMYALVAKDDFRREAWEGFVALPEGNHEATLEKLRQRLSPPTRHRRLPPGFWMAAAAALVLLFGALYFFPGQKMEEAALVARNAEEAPVQTMPSSGDEITADDDAGAPDPALSQRKAVPLSGPAPAEKVFADDLAMDEVTAAADKEAPSGGVGVPAAAPPATSATRTPELTGFPADSEKPGTYSGIPVVGGPESVSNAQIPAPGRAKSADIRTDSLQEIQRESAKKSSRAEQKAEPSALRAAPEGGWDSFHAYIRQNARLTPDARNHNATGTVRLRFRVDKNGKAEKIKIENSLGYGCDEEAERLVKTFKWAPPGAKDILVDIPFVR